MISDPTRLVPTLFPLIIDSDVVKYVLSILTAAQVVQ